MRACVCVCVQRVGFLPSAGEAVTWRTLQQPVRTFDFHWTVLDVTPSPEEENTHYCKHERHTHMWWVKMMKINHSFNINFGVMSSRVLTFCLSLSRCLSSAGLDFGAVLVKPSFSLREAKRPLVVFIHGLCLLQFLCVAAVFLLAGWKH